MASSDRLGLEAIKSLHSQLDDDANGNIDLSESDDVSNIFIHLILINCIKYNFFNNMFLLYFKIVSSRRAAV